MKIFQADNYPTRKVAVTNRTVVEILLMDERSRIRQGYKDDYNSLGRQSTRPFGVNYAIKKPKSEVQLVRGFAFAGTLYQIVQTPEEKRLLVQPSSGQLWEGEAGITTNLYVFEGNIDEFLQVFRKAGYKKEDKQDYMLRKGLLPQRP